MEQGRIRLVDPLVMLDVDRVGGSGILQFFDAPLRVTVKEAAFFLIPQSDNTATNLLIVWKALEPGSGGDSEPGGGPRL